MRIWKTILNRLVPSLTNSTSQSSEKVVESKIPEIWAGEYSTWEEAKAQCTGYDSANILEKCKAALLKVKNGEAVYERDSVLFDEIQYSWGLLAGLQKAALENEGKLCVLDFGGSLGSTYFQNKEFLNSLKQLKWWIVEQSNFVTCGKENFENGQLKFFHSIDECFLNDKPNVLLLSGVLQYLERPYEWVEKFLLSGVHYLIIDRTSFVEGDRDILTIQNVPGHIYNANYPAWFFGTNLLNSFKKKYEVLASFDNGFTPPIILNTERRAYWKGAIMKLIK